MTRIDCAPVEELSDSHLISNYKELPRAFGYIRRRLSKNLPLVDKSTPTHYTMGEGHVKFFYNKFLWLKRRYREIHKEMIARGFRPSFEENYDIQDIMDLTWGTIESNGRWEPNERDMEISRARIKERVSEKPNQHRWTLRTPPNYIKEFIDN